MNGAMVLRRGISTSAVRKSAAAHPEGGMKLWKNLTFFMALPATAILSVNVFLHLKKESECPPPRPEFIAYDHLRIRNKRFPWGDGQKSLFHNPHVNALPNGYEDHHDEH